MNTSDAKLSLAQVFGGGFILIGSLVAIASLIWLVRTSDTTVITVVNRSSSTLSNMALKGSDVSEPAGSLAPGTRCVLKVHPAAETGFRLYFDVGGKRIETDDFLYLPSGTSGRVEVTIETNYTISTK